MGINSHQASTIEITSFMDFTFPEAVLMVPLETPKENKRQNHCDIMLNCSELMLQDDVNDPNCRFWSITFICVDFFNFLKM